MKLSNPFKLIIAIVVAELAGAIGAIFTIPAIPTWYATLIKSPLNPPSWVFAPVWNILFILMGIAAFLVWKKGLNKKEVRVALIVFLVQLILNALWSVIFFGLHNPGAAFLEIIVLWLAILATIITFYKVSRGAAYLLIPYILWVTFAGYLTFSVWNLNIFAGFIPATNNIACTLEAKICPDGSAVGRRGPNCEFAACPTAPEVQTPNIPTNWLTYINNREGISFRYPGKLGAQYISSQDWPPTIAVSSDPFVCEETPGTSSLPARTLKRLVDDRVYCVEAMSEGAAGSVYTEFTYTTQRDSQLIVAKFTLRYPQCDNYDDPAKTTCKNERETFDLDGLVDRMLNSLKTLN